MEATTIPPAIRLVAAIEPGSHRVARPARRVEGNRAAVARPLRAALGELKLPELGGGQQAVPPAQRMGDSLESAEQATRAQATVALALTQAQAATVAPPRTAPSV